MLPCHGVRLEQRDIRQVNKSKRGTSKGLPEWTCDPTTTARFFLLSPLFEASAVHIVATCRTTPNDIVLLVHVEGVAANRTVIFYSLPLTAELAAFSLGYLGGQWW